MSYTYYATMRPLGPGCTPAPAGNEPIRAENYEDMKHDERCGKPSWGWVTYAKPLERDYIVAYELTSGRLPSQKVLLGALDSGDIFPAIRDGLLCICIVEDTAAGITADALPLHGDLTVSKFWRNGIEPAARLVANALSVHLANDELAGRVIEFIRALGGREPHISTVVRQARMSEVASSAELAALCA